MSNQGTVNHGCNSLQSLSPKFHGIKGLSGFSKDQNIKKFETDFQHTHSQLLGIHTNTHTDTTYRHTYTHTHIDIVQYAKCKG